MAPKKQQSKAEGAKKKENNKGGGNKATTSTEDDECADMPPLEDMRKSGSASTGKGEKAGGKEAKEEVKLPELRWSEGSGSTSLCFGNKGLSEAYEAIGLDPSLEDNQLFEKLEGKVTRFMDCGNIGVNSEALRMTGAALMIACSRVKDKDRHNRFLPFVGRLYSWEADFHVKDLALPLPKVSGFDTPAVSPFIGAMASVRTATEILHHTSKEAQTATEKDKARLVAVEKEAKEMKRENEKLKIELIDYKAEVKEGYKARDEKATELEKVKGEKEDVKSEWAKEKSENAKLKEELAKLRASSSSSAPSQVASSDKTSFVIKSLSRQVKDLGRQVKEKNNQLAEMMVEMSKVGCE